MKILGLLICIFISPLAKAESSLNKMDLRLCSFDQSRCLTVKAEQGQGSSVQHLFFMRNPSLKWNHSPSEQLYTSGYVDFNNNKLVLTNIESRNQVTELAIDLKTLQQRTYRSTY